MSKRTLYIPDETWHLAERLAGERGLEQRGKAYSVSEYIRLLVESDNGEVRADDASPGVGRSGRGQGNAASQLGDGARGKDAAGEPAQATEVGGGPSEASLAYNAEKADEQSARETPDSLASERLAASGRVPRRQHTGGGPTQREEIQRDESPPSTEVDRRDKQEPPPRIPLAASVPFAGPITKESQTRKNRGKK